jgi:hypothetical protein
LIVYKKQAETLKVLADCFLDEAKKIPCPNWTIKFKINAKENRTAIFVSEHFQELSCNHAYLLRFESPQLP